MRKLMGWVVLGALAACGSGGQDSAATADPAETIATPETTVSTPGTTTDSDPVETLAPADSIAVEAQESATTTEAGPTETADGFPSFTTTSDYRNAAVEAINGSNEFEDGTCDEPISIEIGTTFDCTGTLVADGTSFALTATIDNQDHVIVGVREN